ncbi:MAG: hypothetical protein HY671_09820 [Chloroflexi bacterium]|nr:hypothetical protein [Chloroflexota bacterium]
MRQRVEPTVNPLGVALIVFAVVLGLGAGIALYGWESTSRAESAASAAAARANVPATNGAAATKPSAALAPQSSAAPAVKPATPVPQGSGAPAAQPFAPAPEDKPKTEEVAPKPAPSASTTAPVAGAVSFTNDVMPIFQKSCVMCHGTMGGLDLKDFNGLMTTGANKPQVVAGKPGESRLIKRLEEKPLMPPFGAALPASDIEKIKQWIAEGAKDN